MKAGKVPAAPKTGIAMGGEPELVALLEKRYPKAEYAFLTQVRNGTGYDRMPRTADALALSLWPSRGLYLHGFEIKCYRGDWQREKQNPAKAEAIAQYCDFWWVVVTNVAILDQLDEVPSTWGVLAPSAKVDRLVVVRQAPKSTNVVPLSPLFIAAILRNASDAMVPRQTLEQKCIAAQLEGKASAEKFDPLNDEFLRLQRMEKLWTRFEHAANLTLRFNSEDYIERLGAAVRVILDQQQHTKYALQRARVQVQDVANTLRRISEGEPVRELQRSFSQLTAQLSALEKLDISRESPVETDTEAVS